MASFVELSVFLVMTFIKQFFNCVAFAGTHFSHRIHQPHPPTLQSCSEYIYTLIVKLLVASFCSVAKLLIEDMPSGVLWSVAPSLVLVLIAYAVLGTWFTTTIFGRRMMVLHFGLLKCEGDLRFDLVRVRENAGALRVDACSMLQIHFNQLWVHLLEV